MSIVKVSNVEVRWNMSKRTVMELALKQAYFTVGADWKDKIIDDSARMLGYEEIGRDFYDILVLGSVNSEDYIVVISNKILKFCNEYTPYEFVEFVRNFYTSEKGPFSSEFNTTFVKTVSIVFSGFDIGYLVGSNPVDRSVYVESDMIGASEFGVVTLVISIERMGSVKIGHTTDNRIEEIKLSPKQVDRMKKYVGNPKVIPIVKELRSVPLRQLAQIAQSYMDSVEIVYFGNYFNIVSDEGYPYYADFYKVASWQREETVSTSSVAIKLYQIMTDAYFNQEDLLKGRNLYIPDRGIVIKFDEKADNIDSIMLREYHDDDLHFLYISYTMQGCLRFLPFDMTDLNVSFIHVLYETDVVAILMVMGFLGLSDKLKKSEEQLDSLFEFYGNKSLTYKELKMYSNEISNIVEGITGFAREDNIHFETPTHWNYENKSKPVQTPWGDTYLIKDRKVGVYTRRLPAGQKASEEAKALAKKVFMELGEDKTIVDEFVRKVKVKLDTMKSF